MKTLQLFAFLCAATLALAQSITIRDLLQFVKSSIQLRQSDSEVAKTLRRMKLTERLDNPTVEELQRLGAGPKIVAALREMVERLWTKFHPSRNATMGSTRIARRAGI